jgi:ABC-2 type transport system permease protein
MVAELLDSAALYFRLVLQSVRAQLSYRASFVALVLAAFLTTGSEFLAMVVAFERFGSLGGWRLEEVAVLYGIVGTGMALADMVTTGFDTFGNTVRRGDFDRILLRPRSTVLQLFGQELTLRRLGRLSQAVLVLGWALSKITSGWTPARVYLLVAAVLGGCCIFIGLWIIQATIAFWTVQTQEMMNVLTYGGTEAGSHPVHIYDKWLRRLFLGVVPIASVSYFPALSLLGRPSPWAQYPTALPYLAPLSGPAFLAAALGLWRLGVRHYGSTGS